MRLAQLHFSHQRGIRHLALHILARLAAHRAQRQSTRAGRRRLAAWERTLYTIVVAETFAILGFNIALPFLPFYIQQLGITDMRQVAFWVGLINSVPQVAMAVTAPFWGLLADRYGRKSMLVRATLAGSVILSLMGVVTTVPQLAGLRIMQGALTGTIAAATTLVATTVPRERCGYALGLLQTGVFVGGWLGPSLGGIIGGTLGYPAAFFASGLSLVVATVLIVFFVSENRIPLAAAGSGGGGLSEAVRAIAHHPVLATMISMLVFNSLANSISGPVLPLFVQSLTSSGQSASTATGMILSATALTNAVGALWIGRAGDRLGGRRVLLLGLLVAALTYFPQALARQPYQVLILRAIMGFAVAAVGPVANAAIARHCPEGRQGGVYGISTSLNAFGGALGPAMGAFIVTNWSVALVFPVTGVLLALMALLVVLVLPANLGEAAPKMVRQDGLEAGG
jgi:MFS transporter, DHA1 family, multidrug resistance protein